MSDTEALVYVDLARAPALVGRLWSRARKGREIATFEYDKTWLEHPERFALEPALTLGPGPLPIRKSREMGSRGRRRSRRLRGPGRYRGTLRRRRPSESLRICRGRR